MQERNEAQGGEVVLRLVASQGLQVARVRRPGSSVMGSHFKPRN